MNPLFSELADTVITVVVPIAATAMVGIGLKVYNQFASWTGVSKLALTASQQASDNSLIQSALSNVAEGVKTDVIAGKVQLTVASLAAEAAARLPEVYGKVGQAIDRSAVGSVALTSSLMSHISAKVLPPADAAVVAAAAPMAAQQIVDSIKAVLAKPV
jgi:hypothetical protein